VAKKTALAVVHMEDQNSLPVLDTDMTSQGHKDQAWNNDCTSKAVEGAGYNGVGKQAVEDAEAVAGVKSLVLEPHLRLWLRVPYRAHLQALRLSFSSMQKDRNGLNLGADR